MRRIQAAREARVARLRRATAGTWAVACLLQHYVKAINSFLAWLHAEGHVREPLALLLQRTEKRIVQTLTVDQLKRRVAIKPKTVAQLRARLNRSVQPAPLLHPNMADFYLEKAPQLARGLDHEKSPHHRPEALRGPIDAIVRTS